VLARIAAMLRGHSKLADRNASKAWAINIAMLRTTGTSAISAHMSNPAILRLSERELAQSKRISTIGRNCQSHGDFEQQIEARSPTQQNGVLYPHKRNEGAWPANPLLGKFFWAPSWTLSMGAYGWHHLRGLSLLGSSRLTPGRTENEWPNSQ
jgi:hypothetical protein